MRFHSTLESAYKSEITIMAIVESFVAMAIVIGIGLYTKTWAHVEVAVSMAPLMLLRNAYASQLGVSWMHAIEDEEHGLLSCLKYALFPLAYIIKLTGNIIPKAWVRYWRSIAYTVFFAVGINLIIPLTAGLILAPLVVRPISLLVGFFKHPLESVQAIPENWKRIVLATDLFCPPEIVPDYQRLGKPGSFYRYEIFKDRIGSNIFERIAGVTPLMMLFLPSIFFRFSIKSTAIVYTPLLWIISSAFLDTWSIRQKLMSLMQAEMEKFRRIYAGAIFIAFYVLPLIFFSMLQRTADWLQQVLGDNARLINMYTFVYELELWHLARLINIGITWGLFFYADNKLRCIEFNQSIDEGRTADMLNSALFIRELLGLYIIACDLYIIYSTVTWPHIGYKPFPWL